MNFRPAILVNNTWVSTDQVFATKREAETVAFHFMEGWGEAEDYRAEETTYPVNSKSNCDGYEE